MGRTKRGTHGAKGTTPTRSRGESAGETPSRPSPGPSPSGERFRDDFEEGLVELREILEDFQTRSLLDLKSEEEVTRRLYRHELLEIIGQVGIQRATPAQLPEARKRLDRLARAAFGVSARDRDLVRLDELALEFAPKYSGTSEKEWSLDFKLWFRCLETGARGDAYWAALRDLAKATRVLTTEMDVDSFKHTVFSAWARSGRKRPGAPRGKRQP